MRKVWHILMQLAVLLANHQVIDPHHTAILRGGKIVLRDALAEWLLCIRGDNCCGCWATAVQQLPA